MSSLPVRILRLGSVADFNGVPAVVHHFDKATGTVFGVSTAGHRIKGDISKFTKPEFIVKYASAIGDRVQILECQNIAYGLCGKVIAHQTGKVYKSLVLLKLDLGIMLTVMDAAIEPEHTTPSQLIVNKTLSYANPGYVLPVGTDDTVSISPATADSYGSGIPVEKVFDHASLGTDLSGDDLMKSIRESCGR